MFRHVEDISSFSLKVIAIVGMTCNHVANALAPAIASLPGIGPFALVALYSLGGLTFPIMAFLLVEGYIHTSNVKRYAARLLVFALISQIPFSLLWGAEGNVLFTLLIGLGVLYAHDHCTSRLTFAVLACLGLAASYLCDWGIIGPVMIYLFFICKPSGAKGVVTTMIVPFAAIGLPALAELLFLAAGALAGEASIAVSPVAETAAAGTLSSSEPGVAAAALTSYASSSELRLASTLSTASSSQLLDNLLLFGQVGYALIGFTIATCALCCYRGTRGRPLKWFFYAYYPLHLLVIWVISALI